MFAYIYRTIRILFQCMTVQLIFFLSYNINLDYLLQLMSRQTYDQKAVKYWNTHRQPFIKLLKQIGKLAFKCQLK